MNHARRFLEQNNKVKFSLIFRGREVTHPDIGLNILRRVAEELSEIATVEVGPKREGMAMMMVMCPKPGAVKPVEKKEKVTEEVNATHEEGGAIEKETQEGT
jgi:translation initiation factor IF-3